MGDAPEIDPSDEAAAEAAIAAEIEAQQQAAVEAAQETAIDDADDDMQGLAELAAEEEGDPFDDDVEEIEDTDDADEDSDTADTEDAVTDSDDGNADTDTVAADNDSDGGADTTDTPAAQTDSTDADSAVTDTEDAARDTDNGDTAPAADVNTDDGAATMAVQSISGFQQRLHDECARRGVAPASDRQEAYAVRRELEEARKRGVEMGLLDPAAATAFDAELEYSDSTLSEDQRNSHGPGSPMYEEARRLGYIRDDRTQSVSSMRLREDDVARRQANDRWRFNHYWQQQAALSRIGAVKTVMIAQDSDSGSRAGFVQLGAIMAELSIGDGIDDVDVEAYIVSQQASMPQNEGTTDAAPVEPERVPVQPEHVAPQRIQSSLQRDSAVVAPQCVPHMAADQAPTTRPHTDKTKEDTHVEIQEFIAAWNEFTDVERRIVLLRTGLVDANDMEQMYMQLQETVTSRTEERDRFQAECDRLRADLEYETDARRDVERELAKLRGQGQPAQE